MRRFLRRFSTIFADVRGTSAIEYALLASLIIMGIIGALNTMAGTLNNTFNTVASGL